MAAVRLGMTHRPSRKAILASCALALSACDNGPEVVDTTIASDSANPASMDSQIDAASEPTEASGIENAQEGQGGRAGQFSAEQDRLLTEYGDINSQCRGGTGDAAGTWHACAKRDVLGPKMRDANLCHGTLSDQSSADMTWHICRQDSLGYAERPPAPSRGQCRVTADGQPLLSGPCLVLLQQDGSFWVMDPAQRTFAAVDRIGGTASSMVDSDAISAETGDVTRDGACWRNAAVEICAWK